jgi:MFS family permease
VIPLRRRRLRRDLRLITTDGAVYSVMVGVAEANFVAFGLAMGLTETLGGLLATVPMLAGALLQLVTPRGVRWMGSHRRWVVTSVILQAMSYLPLYAAALLGSAPPWLLFLIVTFYWGSGMAAGPPYNTWLGTLIPERMRAPYFAWRTRVTQVAVFASLLAGAAILQRGTDMGFRLATFGVLFLIGFACRLTSALCLSQQSEPVPLPPGVRSVSASEFFRRFRHSDDGRLLLYLIFIQIACQIAQPFFTPYMLERLRFSYLELNGISAMAFAAKIIALPLIGQFASRAGARRLFFLGGFGIVPLPALWMISHWYPYLLVTQCLSGVAWASFELASLLLFFETLKPEERTSLLTTFNVCNCAAMVVGSLIGGALLHGLGETLGAYLVIFGVSSLARGMTLPFLVRFAPREIAVVPIATRTDAVLPSAGSIDRPILASLPEHAAEPLDQEVLSK